MPQALIAVAIQLVGPFGLLGGGLLNAIGIPVDTGIIGNAIGLGPKGPKVETTERTVKGPTPLRVHGYGERRLFGALMIFDTNGDGKAVDVLAFHDGRANACTGVYLNDELVTITSGDWVQALGDGTYGGDHSVTVSYRLGLPTETAFATVISALPGIWTSNHRGDGIVSAYLIKRPVKSKDFLEVYPQGDNIALSLALQLQLVFDPRAPGQDPYDASTWTYSTNAALHLLHYFMTERGEDWTTKFAPVEDYWIAAADDCDIAMDLAAGGTEPRYRGCVVYDSAARPADVVSELLTCFDGWTALDENGCRMVYSGRLYEPTVTIGPSDITAFSYQSFVEEENTVNELLVQYISSDHKLAVVEAQSWRDEADIVLTGRIRNDTVAPQVPSYTQARRLAKRSMLRRNAPDRGSVSTKFSGRAVMGQRFINLELVEAGATFFSGVAEIVSMERDYDTGGVRFEWIAVDPDLDEWDPETEDGAGATDGVRVPLAGLDAPVITSALYFGSDNSGAGTAGARARIIATGLDRDDLTWFARWRSDGATIWNTDDYPDLDPGASVTIETGFLPVDTDVEVEVAYLVGDGRLSPWSATEIVATGTITSDSTTITADSTIITADRI